MQKIKKKQQKDFFSTQEVADLLGISRIAVFKKIKSGEIQATKAGRSYIILQGELPAILEIALSDRRKEDLTKAVRRTVREYGETLKLLGRE